jgi:hypothetical protein
VVTNPSAISVGKAYYLSVNRRQSTVWLENLQGIVNIYFHFMPTAASDWGTRMTVYNGAGTIIASTDVAHNNASQLTSVEKQFLSTSPRALDFKNAISPSDFYTTPFTRSTDVDDIDFGRGIGKVQIAAPGTEGKIIIKLDSLDPAPNYKFLVEFPSIFSADVNIINDPACDPSPPVYKGTLEAGQLTMQQWSCSNIFRVNTTGYKAFILKATGLKANTVHQFYVDTEFWPETVLVTQSLYNQSQYSWRRDPSRQGTNDLWRDLKSEIAAHPDLLLVSPDDRINEVTKFLSLAFGKLYTSSGAPGPDTVLKTDQYGKMTFVVFFPLALAGWFSQDFNARAYRLNYSGYDMQTLQGEKMTPTYGSSGYTSLVLQDSTGTSQASRIFANRTPNKTIPYDSRGYI